MSDDRVYHWSELKFANNTIDKRMLLRSGVVLKVKSPLKGDNTRSLMSTEKLVLFDKSYIAYRILRVLKPIQNAPTNVLIDIMQEVLMRIECEQDGIPIVENCGISLTDDELFQAEIRCKNDEIL